MKGLDRAQLADIARGDPVAIRVLENLFSQAAALKALAFQDAVDLSTQATGTLQAAQEPAHTGDVTNSAGSLALTIAPGAVGNSKLANMGGSAVKASGFSGAATDVHLGPSQLLGRGSTGSVDAITLGANLVMTGTTLSAAGGGGSGNSLLGWFV